MTYPKIKDAPGHIGRKHTRGFECRWQCRTDLVEAGFTPKSRQLFAGEEPDETWMGCAQGSCRRLKEELLTFGCGGLAAVTAFEGTLRSLISCYQTDPDGPYQKRRYRVRRNRGGLLRRIAEAHGGEDLG